MLWSILWICILLPTVTASMWRYIAIEGRRSCGTSAFCADHVITSSVGQEWLQLDFSVVARTYCLPPAPEANSFSQSKVPMYDHSEIHRILAGRTTVLLDLPIEP